MLAVRPGMLSLLTFTMVAGLSFAAPKPAEAVPTQKLVTDMLGKMEFPTVPDWKAGQQATHKVTVDMGQSGTVTMNVRLAVTGVEDGAYWYEWNLSNFGGTLGSQVAPYMGELNLRFLTAPMDAAQFGTVVTGAAKMDTTSVTSPIKKFQYQIVGQPLYEVKLDELVGQATDFVAPPSKGEKSNNPIPKEVEADVKFATGRENVTVTAGTFINSLFWDANFSDKTGSGNVHVNFHENIPLLPLAKVVSNISSADGGNYQVRMELISSAQTGSKTLTTGEPIVQTVDELFGQIFGLIMGGGGAQFK